MILCIAIFALCPSLIWMRLFIGMLKSIVVHVPTMSSHLFVHNASCPFKSAHYKWLYLRVVNCRLQNSYWSWKMQYFYGWTYLKFRTQTFQINEVCNILCFSYVWFFSIYHGSLRLYPEAKLIALANSLKTTNETLADEAFNIGFKI